MNLSFPRLSSIFVLDHQQALDFYVGTLGLEVGTDADLGFMRWLTVRTPGDDREILLQLPGPPAMDPQTTEQVRELVAAGVEITDGPSDQSYGRDFGLRDPFGNALRIGNVTS